MSEPLGCDEFGNGCGCKHCVAEAEARIRFAREWEEALGGAKSEPTPAEPGEGSKNPGADDPEGR